MSKKAEEFWAFQRQRLASEANSLRHGERLSIEERLAVVRLLAAEGAKETRKIVQLAEATKELAAVLGRASTLAEEIHALNGGGPQLISLSTEPVEEDTGEWRSLLQQVRRGAEKAAAYLAKIAPDVVEQLGTLAVDDPKPRGKTKA